MKEKILIDNTFENLAHFLKHNYSAFFVLVDENTLAQCYPLVEPFLPAHQVIQIKAGEENKVLETCAVVWEKLTEFAADRNALLINLGGGVIGDLGGFSAACYKRGIRFINIPTTLLAMVDASVGGKTGIDFMGFKNQIGLFSEPKAVFINTGFLNTLTERELKSGFAEVLKHYLVAERHAFLALNTKDDLRRYNWPVVIENNIKIKLHFVKRDLTELNVRKALNFGHTVGHAVETWFLKEPENKLLHGEAIAVGMICESQIAFQKEFITDHELLHISRVIMEYFMLPVIPPRAIMPVLEIMKQDKKNANGAFQFTLLKKIGNYCIDNTVEESAVIDSFHYYNSLHE